MMGCQRAAVWGRLVCSVNTNKLDCLSLLSAILKVYHFKRGWRGKWREDVTRSPVLTLSWVLNSFLELQTYIRSPVTGCCHTLLGVRFSQLVCGNLLTHCRQRVFSNRSGRVWPRVGAELPGRRSEQGGGGLLGGRMSGIPLRCRELECCGPERGLPGKGRTQGLGGGGVASVAATGCGQVGGASAASTKPGVEQSPHPVLGFCGSPRFPRPQWGSSRRSGR